MDYSASRRRRRRRRPPLSCSIRSVRQAIGKIQDSTCS
jgi:hypothetical protein